jgi:Fe-S-cluster containining protein
MSGDPALPAGDFSSWIVEVGAAIRNGDESDVPCNGCTACCRSSQFVHIGPDETETLAHIPAELLFPAPGRPRGHVVLGYDERGHCPMLVDDKCSIYDHRPNACRTYDCRVFAAAGIDADADKVEITRRVKRWKFDFSDEHARIEHDAIRAAASFLREHAELLRDAGIPANETQLAVLAVAIHDLFVERDESDRMTVVEPDRSVVSAELLRLGARRS